MERQGATKAMEAVPEEWAAAGEETGLEVPMWQLGLDGEREAYPERPGELDCIYYVRTGFCGYGDRCRYNHPRDRSVGIGALRGSGGEYPERAGQPICQYYMRTGMCKYGASCKYHHPKQGVGSSAALALNIYGYPLRPGEKDCAYYIRTGQCKFGVTCKFHHPQPAGVPAQAPGPVPPPSIYPTLQSPVQSSQQYGVIHPDWPVPRTPVPGSYVPGNYGPFILPPPVLPGWSPYQAPVSPIASASTQTTAGANHMMSTSLGHTISSTQMEHVFPERPGEPDCQYYLRTGDCKFGATCKYHHPTGQSVQAVNFTLSQMGLPLRPGAPVCLHYAQNGVCKFGPSCKYDHPMGTLSFNPSGHSPPDMPVGLIYSSGEVAAQSDTLLHGQGANSSGNGSGTDHGGEVQTSS